MHGREKTSESRPHPAAGARGTGDVDRAHSPAEISERGWRDVLRRSAAAMVEQDTSLAAAGIAFYMVWALFPALALMVLVGAELLGARHVLALLSWARLDFPEKFNGVIIEQLSAVAQGSRGYPLATLAAGASIAAWSGVRGALGLVAALNRVYREREQRTFTQRLRVAFGLALLGGVFLLLAIGLIVGFSGRGTPRVSPTIVAPSRWPVLAIAMMLLLAIAYRYAPSRRPAKWRWVTWGAAVSATIWSLASFAASYYADHFGQLNPLLGSLGSVVIFLFWCYLTVLVVLLGAHINAQLEQHTTTDSTAGAPRPAGQRGARVADTTLPAD